jgi:hypothetical protein
MSNIAQLFKALAGARNEFPEIPRNRIATIQMKSGGKYSYKYADLSDVIAATTPALSAWGLSIMQYPEDDQVVTILAHESGASKEFLFPIKPMPQRTLQDSTQFQSAFQVAKRYALTGVLGISTEETIEGDAKGHKVLNSPEAKDPFHEPDGIRAPRGAIIKDGMTKEAMAEEAARAIEAQMDEVKTAYGLNGVWSRNERFIEKFKESYDPLFQNIFDKFHARMEAFGEPDE